MSVDITKVAQSLIDSLSADLEKIKWQIEGIKLLHEALRGQLAAGSEVEVSSDRQDKEG